MPWFPYHNASTGSLPYVNGYLARAGQKSGLVPFLIDSEASYSIVPEKYVRSLLQGVTSPEEFTGAYDANGQRLMGRRIEFEVQIKGLDLLTEPFWVSSGSSSYYVLLGQTWFEAFGAHFENFPSGPKGRRFALYRCPLPPR